MFNRIRRFESVIQELAIGLRHGVIVLDEVGIEQGDTGYTRSNATKGLQRWDMLLSEIRRIGDALESVTAAEHAELNTLKNTLAAVTSHYEAQYTHVREQTELLSKLSRMQWARLSPSQQSLCLAARLEFAMIPEAVVEREESERPHDLANVLAILGASALYANEIDLAERYLVRAARIYKQQEVHHEDYGSMRTEFFLGLLAKSWLPKGRSIHERLDEARQHLQDAAQQLLDKSREYLVPITLAEVLSYTDDHRDEARRILTELIVRMQADPMAVEFRDRGAVQLLYRAYLIMGNILMVDGDVESAQGWYVKAAENRPDDYIARTYAAIASSHGTRERQQWFEDAFQVLQSSRVVDRTDLRVRVASLIAAVVSTHETGRSGLVEHYMQLLNEATSEAAGLTHTALLVSPFTKRLEALDIVIGELREYVQGTGNMQAG